MSDIPRELLYDLENYLESVQFEQQLTKNTVRSYQSDLIQYFLFLQEKGIHKSNQIKEEDIIRYLTYLAEKKEKTTTIAHALTCIKNFHKFLVRSGSLKQDVSDLVERPKLRKSLPHTLSETEVNSLLEIPLQTVFDYRNKAMLELLYGAGLRISELLNLSFQDIDMQNGVIRIFGKGRKERIVPLGEYASEAIEKYLPLRPQLLKHGQTDFVFLNNHGRQMTRQGFFKILQGITAKLQLKEVSPHTLRHSFATHMLDGGADLKVIQELLGHADLTTTKIYTHVSNKKIKDDYENYHPRNHTQE